MPFPWRVFVTILPLLIAIAALQLFVPNLELRATMEEALFTLIMNEADSAIGVEEINDPLFKRSAHGLRPINRVRGGIQTDFDAVFRETWTSLASRNSNLKKGSLTGARVANFLLSEEECFFINSERSLLVARTIAQELK